MIQYPDAQADACGTVGEPYNISGSNNQFSVAIDAGSNQVFTLTSGSARTAAQVVADLSGLTGAIASVVSVNGTRLVRVRTSSLNGPSSSVLVNAPTNNANATLGFVATTHTGGDNVAYSFLGDTKQKIIDGVEQGLLNAGWITISGHSTTNLLMQSSMTQPNQNLRMRVRIKDNGGTSANFSVENVFGTKVGSNSSSVCNALLPQTARVFKVIANKHQAFILVPFSAVMRDFVCFGTPWIPTFLADGKVWEAFWLQGNSQTDTVGVSAGFRYNFMNGVSGPYRASCVNGSFWESQFNTGGNQQGDHSLWVFKGTSNNTASYRWFDLSSVLGDPLIAWGTTGPADEGLIRGQLWSAFVSADAYPMDDALTGVDGHTWQPIVNGVAAPQLLLLVS